MAVHGLNPIGTRDADGHDYAVCECGTSMEWDDCDQCGGDGMCEYMDTPEVWGEDCPSEVNHLVTCPECGGAGGLWWCSRAVEEANERVRSDRVVAATEAQDVPERADQGVGDKEKANDT